MKGKMPKVLDKFIEMLKKDSSEGFLQLTLPKHIAVVTKGKTLWAKKHNSSIEEAYTKSFSIIRNTALSAIKLKVPIITFYILSTHMIETEKYSILMDQLKSFFDDIATREFIL
jgi:undecaprenyl pyrophosphate synthase